MTYDKDKTAVLIMDYQREIVSNYAGDDPEITTRAAAVLAAAPRGGNPRRPRHRRLPPRAPRDRAPGLFQGDQGRGTARARLAGGRDSSRRRP